MRATTIGRHTAGALLEGLLVALLAITLISGYFVATASGPQADASVNRTVDLGSVAGEVLVRYQDGVDAVTSADLEAKVKGRPAGSVPGIGVRVLKVPVGTEATVVAALSHHPAVRYAELNYIAGAAADPNDPYYPWSGGSILLGGQWGDGLTQVPTAWDITRGSAAITVAIVDSGIDDGHPDLAGRLTNGVSVVGGSTIDTSGHGEYVAGVVGEGANNGIGAAGYCWFCRLMPVKVTNGGSAYDSDLATGITWAADHGARVINVSYAGPNRSSTLDAAVAYATNHGAIVVAAAGNSGCNCVNYPAGSPGAIAVAASDQHDNLMTYSDWGSWVQVAAPTGDITTWLTLNGQPYGYAPVGGTSISSPVVAGIIALMLSYNPAATVDQVKAALFGSVDPITGVNQSGGSVSVKYGRVNAYRALLAMGAQPPSSSAGPTPSPIPTATPVPSASAGPTPSPIPTASPNPTPTPSTTSTSVFKGSVTAKQSFRNYPVRLGGGPLTAMVSATNAVGLTLLASDGSAVASSVAGSMTLTATVAPGTYTLRVLYLASKASFKLTATYPTP